jgi:hypothetical protein
MNSKDSKGNETVTEHMKDNMVDMKESIKDNLEKMKEKVK